MNDKIKEPVTFTKIVKKRTKPKASGELALTEDGGLSL